MFRMGLRMHAWPMPLWRVLPQSHQFWYLWWKGGHLTFAACKLHYVGMAVNCPKVNVRIVFPTPLQLHPRTTRTQYRYYLEIFNRVKVIALLFDNHKPTTIQGGQFHTTHTETIGIRQFSKLIRRVLNWVTVIEEEFGYDRYRFLWGMAKGPQRNEKHAPDDKGKMGSHEGTLCKQDLGFLLCLILTW